MRCSEYYCDNEAMRNSLYCLECQPAHDSPDYKLRKPYEVTCLMCGNTHDEVLSVDEAQTRAIRLRLLRQDRCDKCGGNLLMTPEHGALSSTGRLVRW